MIRYMTIKPMNEAPAAAYLEFTLGDRLARSLRYADLGVTEMADILGVTRETVGRWMHDRNEPKRAALLAWAAITNVGIEWLETGETPNGATDRYHPDGGVVVAFARPIPVRSALTGDRRRGNVWPRHLVAVS